MNLLRVFLFVLCGTIFSQCTRKDLIETDNAAVNKNAILQVEQLPADAQKSGYRLLSAAEKAEIWKRRIRNFQSGETLSNEQENFLTEMHDFLTPEVFEKSNTPHFTGLIERYRVRSKIILGSYKSFVVGASLMPLESFDGKGDGEEHLELVEPDPARPECDCNSWDDWCSYGKICYLERNNCVRTVGGCGLWFTKPCDGMCGAKVDD